MPRLISVAVNCLFLWSFPRLQAQINSTSNFDIIQQSWSGAGHAEETSKPLYAQKPKLSLSDSDCMPSTGYPSQDILECLMLASMSANIQFWQLLTIPASQLSSKSCQLRLIIRIGACYSNLVGLKFDGIYRISQLSTGEHQLDLTLAFPYQIAGRGAWPDFLTSVGLTSSIPQIYATAEILKMGTIRTDNVIMYTLTTQNPWRPQAWFADRRPKIQRIIPSYAPEEGGTTVTILGQEFSKESVAQRLRRIVLSHDGEGGVERECCSTTTVSDTVMICRTPRVSCLSSNPTKPCPKPGTAFVNQTAAIAIRPLVKGFVPGLAETILDDFVSYEGDWEVVDEDVYGGLYVQSSNVILGERQILKAPQGQAGSCCPVCPSPGSSACKITIAQATTTVGAAQPGVYTVQIPAIMNPGTPASTTSGVCDAVTNYANASLTMGIERSTDPTGFTPATPLSITSCMDQIGACRTLSRVSIRVTCNQLVWSTGRIDSSLPAGQTVETYQWITDSQCDRRMRCIGGACMWTRLASSAGQTEPKLQRRVSSAQIGLLVAWMNPKFISSEVELQSFLSDLAVRATKSPTADSKRVQVLQLQQMTTVNLNVLGTTFAVRQAVPGSTLGTRSSTALCVPDPGYTTCTMFSMIVYLLSDGPGTLGTEIAAQQSLEDMASSAYGDTRLRELNIYRVCVDRSNVPADAAKNLLYDCYKVQYPGVIAMDYQQTPGGVSVDSSDQTIRVRVNEQFWAYAQVAVMRTGGSDLGCTVDYRTASYNGTGYAAGGGVDFSSKNGQLRWLAGETAPKYIIVPIRSDGITELDETFEVWIVNVVNASMLNDTQRAVITIVGINDWPEPLYITTTLRIIGAVCGTATALPCALYLARLVRSIRSDLTKSRNRHGQASRDVEEEAKGDGGKGGKRTGLVGMLKSLGKGKTPTPPKRASFG